MVTERASYPKGRRRQSLQSELPNAAFQLEGLEKLWKDGQQVRELASLLEGLGAYGVTASFFCYDRTDGDVQTARALISRAAASPKTREIPDLVVLTEPVVRADLTSLGSSSGRTLLFHDPEDEALVEMARGVDSLELVPCSSTGEIMTSTSIFQRIAASHLQLHSEQKETSRPVFVVGHIMKQSRSFALSRQGLLHLEVCDGVCFVPVDEAAPIRQQQERFKFDVLIHKASDWIVHSTGHPKASLALPPLFESLASSALRWLDSVDATMPVLSRTEMHKLLLELAHPEGGLSHRLILPVTDSFTDRTNLEARTPFIIKSNAACGVSFSHNMIIVRSADKVALNTALEECYGDYRDLVMQDLMDHEGYEAKVYCIGRAVHIAKRTLSSKARGDEHRPVYAFDSLRAKNRSPAQEDSTISGEDMDFLHECAAQLRRKLGLRLFGFDALKVKGSGKLAIIDVNYFPSYNGIPEAREDLHQALVNNNM